MRVKLSKNGVDYSLKRLYRIVEEIGYRLIKPRYYRAEEVGEKLGVDELLQHIFIMNLGEALVLSWGVF